MCIRDRYQRRVHGIAKTILNQENMKIVSVLCSPNSKNLQSDLGEILKMSDIGIQVESTDDLKNIISKTNPDIVVDFSRPEATLINAEIIAKMKVNMVVGTTGFSELEIKRIQTITSKNHVGIVYAPNITLGVNVLMILTKLASSLLNSYDFQITEVHHKNKKDIPSGTAVKIAKEIKGGLKCIGKNISESQIPINSVRAGGVIGKHEVLIVGEEDKITISHESFSRKAFALGAIQAINFIYDKIGFYEMKDVLNLAKVLKNLNIYNQEIEEEIDQEIDQEMIIGRQLYYCLLYTSPSPRDLSTSRMPSSA
eukprot:TRINITY_DN4725_c0_g1_i7.p1 TRINITY_DN4725_c0_g1~~TRINITY_DN4725_c0_g1_i7.p1  ORF type:complete len:311 (-),score=51.54 TRINITY_DN4725_c0_g1_i7:24-956(-)